MRKISLFLAIALLFCLMLTGCAKLISEKSIEVEAVITDKNYDAPYTTTTMILAGKVMVPQMISHPADYDIYFEYDGVKGELDTDQETYEQYNVGDKIKCTLITRKYDDGSIKIILKALNDN